MPIVVLGTNHNTAPIDVRERFAMARTEAPAVLADLVDSGAAAEAVLVSTCNRTEIYLSLADLQRGDTAFREILADRVDVPMEALRGYLYLHRDKAAVRHLFKVTSGLDSMVLGEPQIQGQVKEAYQLAQETRGLGGQVVGSTLNRLFQAALRVGGRVRSETEIGVGAASISGAAVELAKKIFGSLRGRNALVIGAGEMSELTLELLRSEGVRNCVVANRTYERARELAGKWGGKAVSWADLEKSLPGTDIVICSTAAPHPVLSLERFRTAHPKAASHPLCIIDIAIPRDVDPRVGDEPNVFLYNIDDLRQIVDDSLDRRRAEIPRAEEIVANSVAEFWSWYSSLAVVPTIRDLRSRGETVRKSELERTLRRLSHLPAEDQQAIDALTRSLLNKFLHTPTVRLREAAGNGHGTAVLDSVRYLFELDEEPKEAEQSEQAEE
ncbi:MAG: glutamyl-tRNA reductase [Gemmatimonas sp.]|nr:glutamyl-tRNA reductase [Gemmatimonas sp.]